MATDLRIARAEWVRVLSEWTPEWERAQTFPISYPCTEEEYLAFDANLLLVYADGFLEILPMPTMFHQLILKFLCCELDAFVVAGKLGTVVPAPYRVQVRRGKFREPDVIFIKRQHDSGIGKDFCRKADLVMEIVSERNRHHDLVTKRDEYARANIPEYWIVDPQQKQIIVLTLADQTYQVHGTFTEGQQATSKLLPGLQVAVTDIFAAP